MLLTLHAQVACVSKRFPAILEAEKDAKASLHSIDILKNEGRTTATIFTVYGII